MYVCRVELLYVWFHVWKGLEYIFYIEASNVGSNERATRLGLVIEADMKWNKRDKLEMEEKGGRMIMKYM